MGDETLYDRPFWVNSFIEFLKTLKKHGIQAICVFDGPNPPKEKKEEQDRRRIEFEKIKGKKERVNILYKYVNEQAQKSRHEREKLDEEMVEEIRGYTKSKKGPPVDYEDIHSIKVGLKKAVERLAKQSLPITEKHKKLAVDIVDSLGFSYVLADGEAETICCQLFLNGLVDGVMSEDTDVLAYGTNLFFSKIDITNERMKCIILSDVLNTMSLTIEEFRDLCILLKCDYNKYYKKEITKVLGYPPDGRNRKKPVNIGPVHAYSLIQKCKRLEKVEEYLIDSDVLNYRRCRQLFTDVEQEIVINEQKPINKKRVKEILSENRCYIEFKDIFEYWKPVECIVIGKIDI